MSEANEYTRNCQRQFRSIVVYMREYELKKNHFPNLEKVMRECFGSAQKEGDKITGSFGALKRITVFQRENKLFVDTEMNRDVNEKIAQETINRYNRFLVLATGYILCNRNQVGRDFTLKSMLQSILQS